MSILEEIQNCPVEWKELGEVCEIVRGNGLQKKDFVDEGIPCIHYGQIYTYYSSYVYKTKSFVSLSLSEKLKKAQTGDIIVATTSENIEDVGKSIVWLGDGDVCIGGHSCIIKTNENPKYINYYMQSIFFQKQKEKQVIGTKVIELYPKNLSKIKIPIPPLEIQEKIVQILDKMTEYVTELTSELTSRKKQYSYYRDKLLSFEDEVYQVEWKKLDEIAENLDSKRQPVAKGGRSSGVYPYYGASGIVDYVDDFIFDGDFLLVSEDGANLVVRKTPIAFSITGKTWVNNHAHVLKFDNMINQKFVNYYLNNIDLSPYISGAAQPKLNQQNLNNIKIPYPSIEIQSRIVQVLDNFDTVCNDLNIGLPKEIELRQNQYEYFRDKLLTFVAEGEYTESRVE